MVLLEHKIATYHKQLAYNAIEKCNYIVEVGFLTANVDDNGSVTLSNEICPNQLTEKTVNQILEMKFTNADGIVKPKVYLAKDWYLSRLQDCEETYKILKEL
jgi:hypothetical protein